MYSYLKPKLPTRRDDWLLLLRATSAVLRRPGYALLAAIVATISLSLFIFSQNLSLLIDVILFGSLPLDAKLGIIRGMYTGMITVSAPLESGILFSVAALFGLNIAMFTYYLREYDLSLRSGSGSLGGIVFGTLGAGCASCGSAIIAGALSMVGGAGAATLLPLDGLEFALLAIPLIFLSTYWLAQGMQREFS